MPDGYRMAPQSRLPSPRRGHSTSVCNCDPILDLEAGGVVSTRAATLCPGRKCASRRSERGLNSESAVQLAPGHDSGPRDPSRRRHEHP